MSNDIMKDLELTNILGLVLPAIIIAQLVTLIIVFFIGMSSSRKAAVPIYRLEKWANQIKNGNLLTNLGFRETAAMKDLTLQCNDLTQKYRKIFFDIDQSISRIKFELSDISQSAKTEITRIENILNTLKYKE
jgi:signal transduction histidine kinase